MTSIPRNYRRPSEGLAVYHARLENNQFTILDSSTGQAVRFLPAHVGCEQNDIRIDGAEATVPDGNGRYAVYSIETGQVLRVV